MLIARVIGTVVASRKHERLVGSKIQIVQPLEPDGETAKGILWWPWMRWRRSGRAGASGARQQRAHGFGQ